MSVVSECSLVSRWHQILKGCRNSGSNREELRKRFVKVETALFRVRYDADDTQERQRFLQSMKFDWSGVCQNPPRAPENGPLIDVAYSQITHEEGITLQDQLNTLIGGSEENTDFSGFLKV